ncbi:MAG TPA: LysR substrate-binding domain-containing protein [Paracoccus sp. (in: a-proteobacteria)]|uniref:LysR substrate-binding domain-containing protein n=1 Tax=uncultured Paracoccus sp. TaxID=189685 RepID=UPI00260B675A|nr:LysR substrate-binding domain-containing protein [uncultured Paracoccus sp.]HMQ40214.1 LysR substrate-binding domain-containing protein [Paracoccus sp. (in: a-proteobacteria)]HMR35859.1 LysR substrate-binding domain-containing protein [Paracoccus sp. (in: a-proteobacteria)]
MADKVVINAVPLIGELVTPAMMQVSRKMPELQLVYRSEMRFVDLSDGATLAVRAGVKPPEERHVVHWLGRLTFALVATQDYVRRMGLPELPEDLSRYPLVGNDLDDAATPWFRWLFANTSRQQIVFRSNDETVMRHSILSGRCAGFLPLSSLLWSPDLVELMPTRSEWEAPLWLVHDREATEICGAVARELTAIIVRQLA